MVDSRKIEPRIEILYPLLIHYSPEAAVLYGYLKNLFIDSLNNGTWSNKNRFKLKMRRWDVENKTGLSFGRQIDAEKDLVGAGLVNGIELDQKMIEYVVSPGNEERLRRFVNSVRSQWNV